MLAEEMLITFPSNDLRIKTNVSEVKHMLDNCNFLDPRMLTGKNVLSYSMFARLIVLGTMDLSHNPFLR